MKFNEALHDTLLIIIIGLVFGLGVFLFYLIVFKAFFFSLVMGCLGSTLITAYLILELTVKINLKNKLEKKNGK